MDSGSGSFFWGGELFLFLVLSLPHSLHNEEKKCKKSLELDITPLWCSKNTDFIASKLNHLQGRDYGFLAQFPKKNIGAIYEVLHILKWTLLFKSSALNRIYYKIQFLF